jgi:hypothetical protein
VLDLGCVPGAWMQVACKEIGPHDRGGLVLGVDIQEVRCQIRINLSADLFVESLLPLLACFRCGLFLPVKRANLLRMECVYGGGGRR